MDSIMERESYNLEFKEKLSSSFLKTVSAYANFNDGKILFGVLDNGAKVGVADLKKVAENIENKINDSIKPQVNYRINMDEKDSIIELTVFEGRNKPYFYKSQAYKRNDSCTLPVDAIGLTRLILEGQNLYYEQLKASNQDLEFSILENKLREKKGIETLNTDLLKTLGLYSGDEGFCNAAEILADSNSCPGIDVVKFGDSLNIIDKRVTMTGMSILVAYDKTVDMYKDYYIYEEIDGVNRVVKERIPEIAFREAVANAIIHRTWDEDRNIQISMYENSVEIVSVGGLPPQINEDEFLEGKFSSLRNPVLADVFFRLGLVEKFGTGIRKIKETYADSYSKPSFVITQNAITIKLPLINKEFDLTNDEMVVYSMLSKSNPKSIGDMVDQVSFGRSKLAKILAKLEDDGVVIKTGVQRGTKYRLK